MNADFGAPLMYTGLHKRSACVHKWSAKINFQKNYVILIRLYILIIFTLLGGQGFTSFLYEAMTPLPQLSQ